MTNKMLARTISLGALVVVYFLLTDGFYSLASMWFLGTFVLFIGLVRAVRYNDFHMMGLRLIGVVVTTYTGLVYLLVGLGYIPPVDIGMVYLSPLTPFYASLITFEAAIRLFRDAEADEFINDFTGKVTIKTGDPSLVHNITESISQK